MIKHLAIIPARKGSKRFPGKNQADLMGMPLIAHTIRAALASGVFDEIIVSSDDPALKKVAEKYKVVFHTRSSQDAKDDTTLPEFLIKFLSQHEFDETDRVTVLLPTCPLRSEQHIRSAMELLPDNEQFLISVTEYLLSPHFALQINAVNQVNFVNSKVNVTSTQKQKQKVFYHPNGAIFSFPKKSFIAQKTFYGSPLIGYKMKPEESVDIDYPYQLAVASALLKYNES